MEETPLFETRDGGDATVLCFCPPERLVEEDRILWDDRELRAERGELELAYVDAVDGDRSEAVAVETPLGLDETPERREERRLARAGASDDTNLGLARDDAGDAVEGERQLRAVAHRELAQGDGACGRGDTF